MTVTLKTGADPDRREEQDTLSAAVGVLNPGETLIITPGTWPGNVTIPARSSLRGSGRTNTILPGTIKFASGGNITAINFPKNSKLIYDSGVGNFSNLILDGDVEFNGGRITGSDVISTVVGTPTRVATSKLGASVNLTGGALGLVTLAGVSSLLRSSAYLLVQTNGETTLNEVVITTTITVRQGKMRLTETTIGDYLQVYPQGSAILNNSVIIR